MTIKFKYIANTFDKKVSEFYIKENIKSIEAFKIWFKEHHFNSTIVEAYKVFNEYLKTEIKELKNF